MKRLLFVLLLSTAACGASKKAIVPAPVTAGNHYPPIAAGPSTGERISIRNISGATAAELTMIQDGLKLANAALKKNCFKQWVLAAHYTENKNLSQQQIFDLVTGTPVVVDVDMYTGTFKANHISKTVGYENDPYDGVVHMNRYFVNSASMVADNLLHEAEGHSQGFTHYQTHSTSQPYGMNYAYEGCSQQQMQAKGGKLYRPPGLRLEIRSSKPRPKHEKHRAA